MTRLSNNAEIGETDRVSLDCENRPSWLGVARFKAVRPAHRRAWLIALLCAACGPSSKEPSIFDAWAEAVVAGSAPQWRGQRIRGLEERRRPSATHRARGLRHAVTVHGPDAIAAAYGELTLASFEAAATALGEWGWPAPLADGGRGGDLGFDIYLCAAGSCTTGVFIDRLQHPSALDSATAFATLAVEGQPPSPCAVLSAYAQGGLLGLDPAEAPAWRTATGVWLAGNLLPQHECFADAAWEGQQHPELGPMPDGPRGALWIAFVLDFVGRRQLSEQMRWLQSWWDFARQYTWDGDRLRGSPDLWETLGVLVERRKRSQDALATEFARWRWQHAGQIIGYTGTRLPQPASSRIRVTGHPGATRFVPTSAVRAWGSHFLRVERPRGGWPTDELRLWLRGEYGVRWRLSALALDGQDRVAHSFDATVQESPKAYLPVPIDEETGDVVAAVTNLSSRLPDSDIEDENDRSFKLTLALADSYAP